MGCGAFFLLGDHSDEKWVSGFLLDPNPFLALAKTVPPLGDRSPSELFQVQGFIKASLAFSFLGQYFPGVLTATPNTHTIFTSQNFAALDGS